jgi:hypothetical protein
MHFLIGLIVVFVVVAIVARRNAGTRQCRWRQDRAGARAGEMRYACINCGAECFSGKGPPRRCLAADPSRAPKD